MFLTGAALMFAIGRVVIELGSREMKGEKLLVSINFFEEFSRQEVQRKWEING